MSSLVKRRLGNTDLFVTQLGFGSMGLRGPNTWGVRTVDESHAERVLHSVVDSGINFIDTAPDYGICEERIGRYLSKRRDEFFLSTKCGCDPKQHADHLEVLHTWTADRLLRNLEDSLRRLKTDHIDVWLLHGGEATTARSAGLLDVMQQAKREGKCRHIGVSTSGDNAADFLDCEELEVFQIPYSCLAPTHASVLSRLESQKRGVIIRGGVAQGGPDAEIQRPHLNSIWEAAHLDELLAPEMSRAEFILRHTLSQSFCEVCIAGTANIEHLNENVTSASKGPLNSTLTAEIDRRVSVLLNQSSD